MSAAQSSIFEKICLLYRVLF